MNIKGPVYKTIIVTPKIRDVSRITIFGTCGLLKTNTLKSLIFREPSLSTQVAPAPSSKRRSDSLFEAPSQVGNDDSTVFNRVSLCVREPTPGKKKKKKKRKKKISILQDKIYFWFVSPYFKSDNLLT